MEVVMLENDVEVIGHSWRRCFFRTDGKYFNEEYINGGAAWLKELLKDEILELDDAYAVELMELNRFESLEDTFRVNNYFGFREGEKNIIEGYSDNYIIWNEDFNIITPPENGYILWASKVTIPTLEQMETMKDRAVLILDADVLRNLGSDDGSEGIKISKQISWEKTILDLLVQIQYNDNLKHLILAKNIFIVFGYDAYIMIKKDNGSIISKIWFISGDLEGTMQKKYLGEVPDAWNGIIFQASKRFIQALKDDFNFDDILQGVLNCVEKILKSGYKWPGVMEDLNKVLKEFNPKQTIKPITLISSDLILDEEEVKGKSRNCFSFIERVFEGSILDHARNIVLKGNDAIKKFPKLSLGSFITIDRKEIESYQNINNLLLEYMENDNIKPLSIAIFGTPGSGKSFGVSQIAQSISNKIKKLEFNVSQFTSENNLYLAFHMVRDAVLSGKIPLVFFDEFDSEKDGDPLGWLKNFLMPMQDGKFLSSDGEHPIGKSIFVFAGGTSSTFLNFAYHEDEEKRKEFKKVKGPDFVSRLRGTIDVLGPNPSNDADYSYILRRALLLRSLSEKKLKSCFEEGVFNIDIGLLNAMLLTKEYKHGARSMESIIDMSRVNGLKRWIPSSLPSDSQLSMHVDAEKFMNIVLNSMNMKALSKLLAKEIYKYYCEKYSKDEIGEWYELKVKERFDKVVEDLQRELDSINCSYDLDDSSFPTVKIFTEEEIMTMEKQMNDEDDLLRPNDIMPILSKIGARVYRKL